MKTLASILLTILILASCQSDKNQSGKVKEEMKSELEADKNTVKQLDVPWVAVYNDNTKLMEMKKNPLGNSSILTAVDIVDALNLKYPQIKLELIEIVANKAKVKIEDATYLTQQMGSAGARVYLAEVTFSLTEFPKIAAVDFRFKEGDHAAPQILTRSSFKDFN